MLGKFCDLPYVWAVVSEGGPFFIFVIPVNLFLVAFFLR